MARPATLRGFTLVEIVVVMFILGVVVAMGFTLLRAMTANAQVSTTTNALGNVQDALRNFAEVNRRLPCPADGAIASGSPGAGLEVRTAGACNGPGMANEARGVVPWVTLGITEAQATDGYGVRITYRVDPALAADNALLMAACDPAGAAAADGTQPGGCAVCPDQGTGVPGVCTGPANAIRGKGLAVRSSTLVGGNDLMDPSGAPATGTAYVLISHGPNHAEGYGSSGVVQAAVAPEGSGELQNAAGNPLQTYYVDARQDDSTTPTHFDDVLARESVIALVNRAGLGPRIHRPPGS